MCVIDWKAGSRGCADTFARILKHFSQESWARLCNEVYQTPHILQKVPNLSLLYASGL